MPENPEPKNRVYWEQMRKGNLIAIDIDSQGRETYGSKPMRLLEDPQMDEWGITALVKQDGREFRQWFDEDHKYPLFD